MDSAPRPPPESRAVLARIQPVRRQEPAATPSALQKAIGLEQSGQTRAAIAALEDAIESSPDPAPLFNRLAVVLIREDRELARAEALLRKAVALAPNNDVYEENLFRVLGLQAERARNPNLRREG